MADTQVVVIGGGPGGYAAAFHAADHGLKTTLIDANETPGGVCLHRGCIPSKALLHVAKLVNESREAEQWGLTFAEPKLDVDKLRGWKDNVIGRLTGGVKDLCRKRGVTYVHARAKFRSSSELELTAGGDKPYDGPKTLSFDHAIVATGSVPALPPTFDLGDPRIMDSTGALALPDVPGKLLVVGGGYIGLEMGTVYAALGSRVTVVEMTGGLLMGADRDLVKPLAKRLDDSFHAIHLNTKVARLKPTDAGIEATLEGEGVESPQTFDRVLVSVGRRPNTKDVGLENTGVELDKLGFVKVDRSMRTADERILAIGDVAGEPLLAHKASREGKVAVETLLGENASFDNVAIPAVVFTDPEIAWCGLTETEAEKQNRPVKVVKFPWAASGRAMTLSRTEGLTKLVFDPSNERVLGMGICGAGAGELISEGVLAVEMAAVARDVAESIHPHPTLSETVMESAEGAFGQPTHIYRPKRA